MSSSGKGQSLVRSPEEVEAAWRIAQEGARGGGDKVIVEGFVDFDYEITLLTIRHAGGTSFCEPIGHRQEGGDYQESWQPHPMSPTALARSQELAAMVTAELGGWGLFGVEFFIKGEDVFFSEVSPRPHDTGMVTLISQDLSEFALHARAILGMPIPNIRSRGAAASAVILREGDSAAIRYGGFAGALGEADTSLRLFGKPEVRGERRLGVALALAENIEEATNKALRAAAAVTVSFDD
jgi:phosphoribosylglycinamide formyltransferase 2